MAKERIFSDEELEQMGALTLELILANLQKGNSSKAGGLAKRMYAEFLGMHDLYRDWVTHLLSFIGHEYGDKALHKALQETVSGYTTTRLSKAYAGKSLKERVAILCAGFRGHLHAFHIKEEENRFVVTPSICGSGGRLAAEGAYEREGGFLKIKRPQEMTFSRPDFPVYCAHCYFQNLVPSGPDQGPLFLTEPAIRIGQEPCKLTIQK
jgi:hypothetical protein